MHSKPRVDTDLTLFLDILKLALKEQWIQILPLFGTSDYYGPLFPFDTTRSVDTTAPITIAVTVATGS